MKTSLNNFSLNKPSKSVNTFADKSVRSTNQFTNADPTQSNKLFEGDNTSGGDFGGDFETFGTLFGSGQFGGFLHFATRPDLPKITHG